jgi:hypothetical protein
VVGACELTVTPGCGCTEQCDCHLCVRMCGCTSVLRVYVCVLLMRDMCVLHGDCGCRCGCGCGCVVNGTSRASPPPPTVGV